MKKSTLVLLAVVAALAVVTWIVTKPAPAPEKKTLTVTGYAPAEKLEERKKKGLLDSPVEIDYPVDGVVIEREGKTTELVRSGEGKDLAWTLKQPVDAPAVKYAVERMVKLFETETASVFSKQVDDKGLARFELDPEQRIRVTLKAGGSIWNGVDLYLGKVLESETEGADEGASKDTWVMRAEDPTTVYRVAGKDLREPFEQSLSELRDKKLFTVGGEDLVEVSVTAPDGSVVALAGTRVESSAPGTEDDKKTYKVEWKLAKPEGVPLDTSADAVGRSLATLRTKEFVAVADAPKDALTGKVWQIRAKTHDGKAIGLTLADGDGDELWARADGREELLKLDKWAAQNLRKTAADLRDRKLLPLEEAQVSRVAFAPEGAGEPVTIARGEAGAWTFEKPASPDAADPSAVLKTLVTSRATRYARPDELEAAKAALAKPELAATVEGGGTAYAVAFGPKMDDGELKGQRWGQVSVDGQVAGDPVLVQDYTATRFAKGFGELRRKQLFDFEAKDIRRLTVVWPKGAKKLELERPPEGGALVPVGLPEGKKAREAVVTTVENTVPALRAKDIVDDKKPADVGLTEAESYVVTAALADGTEAKLLIGVKADGTDPYATAVGGPLSGKVFTINKYQADNLQKEPADLIE